MNVGSFDIKRVLEMDPEFLNADGEHVHDDSVSSVAWSFPDLEVNVNKLNTWISSLMQDLGTELFRYKGVLAVKGSKKKFVFQGVHMLFTGGFDHGFEWAEGEKRESRFVFIGKHVKDKHAEHLKGGFLACKSEENLRFNVGDEVECRASSGWQLATVVKQWDDGNPYRLEIQNKRKTNVWGPIDSDKFVRAPKGDKRVKTE